MNRVLDAKCRATRQQLIYKNGVSWQNRSRRQLPPPVCSAPGSCHRQLPAPVCIAAADASCQIFTPSPPARSSRRVHPPGPPARSSRQVRALDFAYYNLRLATSEGTNIALKQNDKRHMEQTSAVMQTPLPHISMLNMKTKHPPPERNVNCTAALILGAEGLDMSKLSHALPLVMCC